MLHNEGDFLKRVIVCRPGEEYFSASDLAAQNMNELPDRIKTAGQFLSLITVMKEAGSEVIVMDELDGHPNSVFTRDAGLCTPMGHIRLRMGLPARRGEEVWLAGVLDSLGEFSAGCIESPGTVEGGDVILAGEVAFIGLSGRTNQEGARQLAFLLDEMGYEVRVHTVPAWSLHLGGVMSVLGPGTVLSCEGTFRENFFKGFKRVNVPMKGLSSGNVICLGGDEIIANAAENSLGIEILQAHGFKVHALDLSEFRKGGGGPTCLILPVERG